jgi:hypothetical protein
MEIENCLLAHPDKLVNDVAVAGVSGGLTSDEKVPRAWVVLSPSGSELGKERVIQMLDKWHKENLSKYKHLKGGIEVVCEVSFDYFQSERCLRMSDSLVAENADWQDASQRTAGQVRIGGEKEN